MSYPSQPGYPQGYPPPPQQQPPGYLPQPDYRQYAPPPQPQFVPPPAPPQPRGTIDDFYDQPAASGKSIASWFQTPGQSITGIIARAVTNADTRPQTDMQTKQPKFYSDGRPMLTLTIPLLVAPGPDFPDGRAAWIISSSDKEDLDLAMQAAGCPPRTVPEAGATVTIAFTGFKQIPGFGVPKKVKQITYQRPAGAGQATPPPAGVAASSTAERSGYADAPAPAAAQPMGEAYAQSPQYQAALAAVQQPAVPNGSGYEQVPAVPVPRQPPVPQQPPVPAPPVPVPQQAPPPPMSMPAGLTPEQQAQLAKLTGAQ